MVVSGIRKHFGAFQGTGGRAFLVMGLECQTLPALLEAFLSGRFGMDESG